MDFRFSMWISGNAKWISGFQCGFSFFPTKLHSNACQLRFVNLPECSGARSNFHNHGVGHECIRSMYNRN